MIAVRKQYKAFGRGGFRWLDAGTTSVTAYFREYEGERILIINNLSNQIQTITIRLSRPRNIYPIDILSERKMRPIENNHLALTLAPFRYLWLSI